ncbi:MAG: GGDEF domain-containing protein [Terriglobales bacterium]
MQSDTPRDSSTPVWNRESILELLTRELARSESSGSSLTVILGGLDPAKGTNREPGENENNLVLSEIARRMSASVRRYDYVGRYTPQQFLILAPGWEPSQAKALAEKLKETVTESPVEISGTRNRATISLVLATAENFKSQNQREVLARMEMALGKELADGGDRVELLDSIPRPTPRQFAKKRRIHLSWVLAGALVLGIAALIFLAPSWSCAPNLVGDILDSSELPPPLPENCVLTTERPAEAIIQSIEKQREAAGLELQGTVTCKVPSTTGRSGNSQDQWLGSLYADGKLQYRRHVLLAASQNTRGGRLFTIEQCLVPWWQYIRQSQEYCRVEDPPWM